MSGEEREREAHAFCIRTMRLIAGVIQNPREVELIRASLEYGYSQGLIDEYWRQVFANIAAPKG